MHLFFGKNQKQEKKLDADITLQFKQHLKKQFCDLCEKLPAVKVAFGKQFKPVFTCQNCELEAVGRSVQRLGPKTLITVDYFCEVLTKELISYQNNIKNPPTQHKKPVQNCENIKSKVQELSVKINEEYKKLKKNTKQKHEQLLNQSTKQNTLPIFEQISKLSKEKKLHQVDDGHMIVKRALCNQKGLCFSDELQIEGDNIATNEKFKNLRKETKIRLKPLEDLIDEINNLEL